MSRQNRNQHRQNVAEVISDMAAEPIVENLGDEMETFVEAVMVTAPVFPFGPVDVNVPRGEMTVYPSQYNGGKSVKIFDVLVPVVSCGLTVAASIRGYYTQTADKESVSFACSIPRGVSFSDEWRDQFRAHAERAALAHPLYATMAKRADAKLRGIAQPAKIERPDMTAVLRTASGRVVATAAVPAV